MPFIWRAASAIFWVAWSAASACCWACSANFSARLCEYLGVDPTALRGRSRLELAAEPLDLQHWQQYIADVAAHRPFRNFEYAVRRSDREPLWFRISGKPVFDVTGQFHGYRGTGTNITARKLAENAQHLSEARAVQAEHVLTDAIESLSDGFILMDADRRFIMCNSRYRMMFPAVADLLVPGTSYETICHHFANTRQLPEGVDRDVWLAKRLASVEEERVQEERLADGRWIRIRQFLTRDGGVVGLRTDITEAKHQEQILGRRKQELLEAQKIARMGHWRLDLVSGDTEWSEGLYGIMGTSSDEYRPTAEDLVARIDEEDRDEVIRRFNEARHSGSIMHWEFRIWNHRGRLLNVQVEGRCEYGDGGLPVSLFGICRDVSEEREAETALRVAKDAAEVASRTKSEFLANMSHELRTPLNAIIGFSDLLRLEMFGPLGERYRDYAEDIHHSGAHLLALINDLLDISRIEAGKVELHEEVIPLNELIDEAIRLSGSASSKSHHRLDLRIPSPVPMVMGDRRCLTQVLINLIGNAMKFTPDDGRIAVAASISATAVEIAVTDTGIGIPTKRIKDLAQPFTQIEGALSKRYGGSGMGLFITKAMIEQHGGSLRIDSRLGEGTRVTIYLPLKRLLADEFFQALK